MFRKEATPKNIVKVTEAVVRRCSVKKVVLEILRTFQEHLRCLLLKKKESTCNVVLLD